MLPQALIFDVDGTLAETERDGHRMAFNAAFREAGLGWTWDEALYGELLAVAGGKERIRAYLSRHHPGFDPPRGESLESFVARLHRMKNAHFARLLEQGAITLRPGVARLIGEARAAGVPLAIATTTSPENVERLLAHTLGPEAPGWFACIVAGDMVPAKKPAPDAYLRVLAELDVEPDRCMAFEDSAQGVAAARGAGVPVIVTPSHYTGAEDFSGAALVVSELGEPARPFRVIAGDAGGAGWVDLGLIRRLLEGRARARGTVR